MLLRITTSLAATLLFIAPANAVDLEGDQLYRVSTVRAAPGEFRNLLEGLSTQTTTPTSPLVMRHSQGDHWDLMIVEPIDAARATQASAVASFGALIAAEEDHFAYGPAWRFIRDAYEKNDFYHIEMFEAVAGKSAELLQQRRMENAYLKATGQIANTIFRRAAGSDVDVFTIGFHKDLEAFAAPTEVSDEQKERAAREAGFKSRADISFYLRSLISKHHDTLATKVD